VSSVFITVSGSSIPWWSAYSTVHAAQLEEGHIAQHAASQQADQPKQARPRLAVLAARADATSDSLLS